MKISILMTVSLIVSATSFSVRGNVRPQEDVSDIRLGNGHLLRKIIMQLYLSQHLLQSEHFNNLASWPRYKISTDHNYWKNNQYPYL